MVGVPDVEVRVLSLLSVLAPPQMAKQSFQFISTEKIPMSAEKITEIVNAYFDAICSLDCEAWVSTFAADAVSHEPGNPPLAGHDMLRAFFNGVAGGF